MSRATFPILLVLMLTLMSFNTHAMAFTLRFGPVPAADDAAIGRGMTDADLPTPLLFNVAVGTDGLTFGPRATAPSAPAVTPTLKAPSQTSSHDRRITRSHQLSGLELLLLRDAQQVAER